MARIQKHHITYEPEWIVEVWMLGHRYLSRVQQTKATEQQYADLTNMLHALTYEWCRMRKDLDTGTDTRILKKGKE